MNRRGGIGVVLLLGLSLWNLSSCKKDEGPVGAGGSPSDIVFPDSEVKYREHVEKLFFQTCAFDACHGLGSAAGRVRLTSWNDLMFGAGSPPTPVVIPNRPDNSELMFRIDGRVPNRMPFGRNPLNDNQIKGIRKWIEEGARNN